MEERENAERSRDSIVRKWNDLVSQIKSIFHITEPTDNSVITAESLIAKVDYFHETKLFKYTLILLCKTVQFITLNENKQG